MNVKAGPSEAGTWLRRPTFLSRHQLSTKGLGRCIMAQTDVRGSQFPDDEDKDGPRNIGLLAIQPPDATASPRIFYWTLSEPENIQREEKNR